jgi:D-tyrosyl-tRNA(Tyr) deacylase
MRLLIQRVRSASVDVEGKTIGKIGEGVLIFLGVTHGDTEKDVAYLAEKGYRLRIFNDENGKMNLSLNDTGGSVLIISQFTLYGDCRKGRRPSYSDAAEPKRANELYELFIAEMKKYVSTVESGEFGAEMAVSLCNDGPVTLIVESK